MLTQAQLKHLLHYDPETGEWIWLNPPNHNTRLKGQLAGNRRRDGYLLIRINGQAYYSSRLAFLYMTGEMPRMEVDHKDRDPANDAWVNLREATSSQNKYNRTLDSNRLRGIRSVGDKWQVRVENAHIGNFDTLEEALAVRDATAKAWSNGYAVLNTEIQR